MPHLPDNVWDLIARACGDDVSFVAGTLALCSKGVECAIRPTLRCHVTRYIDRFPGLLAEKTVSLLVSPTMYCQWEFRRRGPQNNHMSFDQWVGVGERGTDTGSTSCCSWSESLDIPQLVRVVQEGQPCVFQSWGLSGTWVIFVLDWDSDTVLWKDVSYDIINDDNQVPLEKELLLYELGVGQGTLDLALAMKLMEVLATDSPIIHKDIKDTAIHCLRVMHRRKRLKSAYHTLGMTLL